MANSLHTFLLSGLFVVAVAGHAGAQSIKIDHTTVDVAGLSSANLDAARQLRMNFSHASVGGNIWDGLTKMATDAKYAMPNWSENNRGNPGWAAKVTEFESWVASHTNEFEVFQNKFCYIDQDANFSTYRDSMLALAAKYPTKVFVWWTMPLMTDGSDNALRATFNEQVRDYCKSNDLPLYDIADIESHAVDGSAVTSAGAEALDPAQSSDGGHLTESGAARAARAQWALMTRIAARLTASPTSGTGGSASATPNATAGAFAAGDANSGANDDSGCSLPKHSGHASTKWMGLAALALFLVSRRRERRSGDGVRAC